MEAVDIVELEMGSFGDMVDVGLKGEGEVQDDTKVLDLCRRGY